MSRSHADHTQVTAEAEDHTLALRAAVLRLRAPEVSKRAPAPTSSVYGRAAAAVPADVRPPATAHVLHMKVRNVETTALMTGTTMALVVLPEPGEVASPLRHSLDLLVAGGAEVLVLGQLIERVVSPGQVYTVPLREDDALGSEWAMIALGPGKRVAFLARRHGPDEWDWIVTRDPVAVQRAGTAILERVPFLRLRVPLLED